MYEAHELILKRHKFTGGVCWPLINLEKFTLLGRLLIARAKWVLSTVANRKQATMLSATLIRLVFTLFRIKKSLMNILLSSASGQVSSIVASTSVQTDYLNKKTPKLWNQSAQLMADTTARVVGERTFWNWDLSYIPVYGNGDLIGSIRLFCIFHFHLEKRKLWRGKCVWNAAPHFRY